MKLKALLTQLASSSLGSQLAPATADDFVAIWEIPSASMRCLRPMSVEDDTQYESWRARSHCLSWRLPGVVSVNQFRQVLTHAVQQQPWMGAQWLPQTTADAEWALILPKQSYLDFEYVDISDMPLLDDESWWSDYGQLSLSLAETPIVHRLLKLDDQQYLYLCCFWPDYLAPQAMLDWLQVLATAWQSTPIPSLTNTAEISIASTVAALEQRLLAVTENLHANAPSTCDLQQQQQGISAAAQQSLVLLCERYQCQLIDILAAFTALLAHEYFAPSEPMQVVGYPADRSGIISACRQFFIRQFSGATDAGKPLAELFGTAHLAKTTIASGWAWAEVALTSELPVFSINHLLTPQLPAQQDFRYRPSQTQGVHLWLLETSGTWQWQLLYDTQRFTPLQWLSRLEQLLIQVQTQDSLQSLLFLTDAERRLYQRATATPLSNDDSIINENNRQLPSQLMDWLYHHARLAPQDLAVDSEKQQLTYQQLWHRSTQWSQQLKDQGAGSEQVIAVHFAASADLIVALLAVWLSGAACVVIDPVWPLLRKRYLIKQTAAHLIVGEPLTETDTDVLPLHNMAVEDNPTAPVGHALSRPPTVDGDALALVLMTSEQGEGVSGVEISHRQLAQQIYSSCQALNWLSQNKWRLLLNAELYSEAFIRQVAMVLSQGGTLVMRDLPLHQLTLVEPLIDYVEIRVAQLSDVLPWLQNYPQVLSQCCQVVLLETPLSEQPLTQALAMRSALPKDTSIWVAYCCAESLGFLALFDYRQRLSARYAAYWPVGKPVAEVEYRVVNAQGRLCPWGLTGELYVRSAMLSANYLPPSRTSNWLSLSTGLPGDELGLWLRTGDRVQHDHKGQLFWLGRVDAQCYIASMRVLPRTLAASMRTFARVQSLAVLPCAPLATLWVIWQPRVSISSSAVEWQHLLKLLKGFLPAALLPVAAVAVIEDADTVATRWQPNLMQTPPAQLINLQHFLQQTSVQQLRILDFWQQRLLLTDRDTVANSEIKTEVSEINPRAYAWLDANFSAIDMSLAQLSLPTWLAALRLTWQIGSELPALLWVEQRHSSNEQSITYVEQLTAHVDVETADRRAAQWITIAEQDWQQGLDHQPACLSLLSSANNWPASQKLAWLVWQIDGEALNHADLVTWQKQLTQRLQQLSREFACVVGVLHYSAETQQQAFLQVIHADHAPSAIRELTTIWLQQLAYLRDFPALPLAGLQCLSASPSEMHQTSNPQQDMHFALTLPQQEMLLLLRNNDHGSKAHSAHVSLGYWLDHPGQLNLHRWQQTLQQWVNAFAALRTHLLLSDQGDVQQRVARHHEVILLSEDWTELNQDWQAIAAATQTLIDRPRRLFKNDLIDYYVIQLSQDLWRLLIIAHPIVLDDRASSHLLLQMYQQYVLESVPNLLDAYPAFLHQQQNLAERSLADSQAEDRKHWLTRSALKKRRASATHHVISLRPQQLARWQFAGVLPADQSGYRCHAFTVNEAIWLPVLQRARREGMPVAFVIKVFYSLLLAQYSDGQQDSLLFEYEAGRSGLFVDSLGCFCRRRALWIPNHLLQSKNATIEQLLQHSKQEYDQTRQLPLEEIASSGLTTQMGFIDAQYTHTGIDQNVMLGFSESLQQPGCVSLLAHAQAQRLTLRLHYYAQEFNPLDFLPRLVSLLEQWLAGVSRLSDLDFLLPEERHQQMQLWSQGNRRIAKWPPIYRLIDEQVARTPDAMAVQCGSQNLTYQQMENLATQTAQRLLQLGCQPGEAVMVCTHAQLYLPSAILGVLKTGACYLPVDISKSDWSDRLQHCHVRFLLTQAACKSEYENQCPELTLLTIDQFDANRVRSFQPRPVAAKDPLYVLYRQADRLPLLVNYEAEANLVQWYCSELAIKPQDRLLWSASADFYATQKNIFAALVSGACLVMSSQRIYNPEQLLQEIEEHQISLLNITPSAFYPLLAASSVHTWQALASLRVVILGKEAVDIARLRPWLGRPDNRCRVLITYAQDVCTDVVASHWLDLQQDQEFVPLGKPVHGVQMFVMDALGRLKPTGLTGQIVILGQTVGRALDESITDPNFVDVPGVGRLFYSDDLACYARPGQLRYSGRVKPSSIHPKLDNPHLEKNRDLEKNHDIENKLRGFDGVLNAKLVQLDHEWVVYLQLANEQVFSADALRNKIQWLLPEKNVPLRLVSVDQLPTDAEGDAA